jgi:hypothetical protein
MIAMLSTAVGMIALSATTLGPPDALVASNIARDAWGTCVLENAAKYAALSESAETIADASVTNCVRLEPTVRQSLDGLYLDNGPKLADATIESIMTDGRKIFRDHAVSTVLEIRMKRKASNGAQK